MGLLTYTLAGAGFILIGAWESIVSSSENLNTTDTSLLPPLQQLSKSKTTPSSSSSITFITISLFSFFFTVNSLISIIDATKSRDQIGIVVQLEVIAISSLFFLYSVLGFLTHTKCSIKFPSQILNLICLFAFVEEFMLFYLQRKDPSGIENRYFDLLLVPITICIVSTILELNSPNSRFPRLGRGIGLILQGMWFIQMGYAFYSNLIVHGCYLHEKSRGNYTVRCKGHPDYHRGRAIATLQFNCNLALLVALIAGGYSFICKNNNRVSGGFMNYSPLEMQPLDHNQARFTLDSDGDDDDDNDNKDVIKESESVVVHKVLEVVNEHGVSVNGSHD